MRYLYVFGHFLCGKENERKISLALYVVKLLCFSSLPDVLKGHFKHCFPYMSLVMRKMPFAYATAKAQIS